MTLGILFLAGFLSGVINAIAAGGALLAFPAMLAAGLSPLTATITSHLAMWPGQLSALIAGKGDLKAVPKKYFVLLTPWLLGGALGIFLLSYTSSETFNKLVPWLLTFTVALFIIQPYMQKHLTRPVHLRPRASQIIIWLAVFLVAIYAGYFGIGVGLMLLTLYGFSRIKSIYQIIALKNLSGFLITLSATIFFGLQNKIAWQEGLVLAFGSLVGGYFGAHFIHKISPPVVRVVVSAVGVILVVICFKSYSWY